MITPKRSRSSSTTRLAGDQFSIGRALAVRSLDDGGIADHEDLRMPGHEELRRHRHTLRAIQLDDQTRRDMLRFISVPWRKIYRRDLVERLNLRFPVGDYFYEDNPFHWASILGGTRIALVPEKLCQHRVARVGQTMSTVDSRLLRIFYHHDNIRDWLRLNGLDQDYGPDLLTWTANQISWVSQRTEGPLQRELFDILCPVIYQYDDQMLEDLGNHNGRGRTYQMLKALKAGDFADFNKAALSGRPVVPDPPRGTNNTARGNTIFARGFYHLRHSGFGETARMTARYVKDRTGVDLVPKRRSTYGELSMVSRNAKAVANEDLMAALIVLQKDIHRIHVQITRLHERQDGISRNEDSEDG